MLDQVVSAHSVNFIIVFLEGLLSFFSPCVIPLIPMYMSYLAGNAKERTADGTISFQRSKVFFHTVFFVLGISAAFFLLGMSFTALGTFFKRQQFLFTRVGGILIILMGLYQLGIFEFKIFQRERRFHLNLGNRKMNPLVAFIMGFTFSFAWTPCVGPALSSVLILASSAKSAAFGNVLVLVYAAGFIIPFLLLGLFTVQVLNFLKRHQKLLKYTVKAGGILLILIGFMTFSGWMNGISKYLTIYSPPSISNEQKGEDNFIGEQREQDETDQENLPEDQNQTDKQPSSEEQESTDDKELTEDPEQTDKHPAIDFTLYDQYGTEHKLSDYKGKVVFLNFWATWCPPCQKEMPDIESIYHKYNQNQDDVVILGVANPQSEDYPYNQDVSKEEVIDFLEENEYSFPTVFDETGELFSQYYITSFPTTFMIDKEGNVYGYVPVMLTKDIMVNIIEQTLDSTP